MSSTPHSLQQLFNQPHEDFWAATTAVAEEIGWKSLLAGAYDLLKDPYAKHLWPAAIEAITCGAEHKHALPNDLHELIARIHYCADQCEELETIEMDEQIWAFVSTWLGLPYTSDWSPYADPDISQRMARMESEASLITQTERK